MTSTFRAPNGDMWSVEREMIDVTSPPYLPQRRADPPRRRACPVPRRQHLTNACTDVTRRDSIVPVASGEDALEIECGRVTVYRATNDPEYRAYKRYLASHHVECWYGCGRRATSPDHRPRRHEHLHIRGTNCCTLHPACASCNSKDGATSGNQARNEKRNPRSERL